MAQGIQTAINIVDGLTPSLRNIVRSLDTTIQRFERLDNASSRAINLNVYSNVGNQISHINGGLRNTVATQERLNNAASRGTSIYGQIKSYVLGVVAAYATWQSAVGAITTSDQLTNIRSRLDLINDGLLTTDQLERRIMESANRTYSSFSDTADMVGKLGVQAGKAFANNQDIVNFAEQINKHLSIAGTSGAAAQGAMIQLTQAMSNGVLRGEELNSVMDGMPTVVKSIEEEFRRMGDNRGIKQIAEDGLITADIVKRALYNSADDINQKFDQMSVTFMDVWNLFKNKATDAFAPVFNYLSELGNSKSFRNFMSAAATSLGIVANLAVGIMKTVGAIGSFVVDNWKYVAPLIYGVLAPLAAYRLALIAVWTWQKLLAGATLIWKGIQFGIAAAQVMLWAFTNTQRAATAATFLFNAAWLANPITWVLLAAIAVLGVIIGLVFYFADSWQEAVGIISGSVAVFGAFIANRFIEIYNVIASVAEFFANVWTNPIYSVKSLFANLATNVLDMTIAMTKGFDGFATGMANAMIDAVNIALGWWNKLVDALPDAVVDSLGLGKAATLKQRVSITSDLENMKGNISKWVGTAPEDYWSAPKLDFFDIGGAYSSGKKFGTDKANELAGMMSVDDASLGNGTAAMLANAGASKLGEIANNTKATADNTSKYDDDIEYLRDIAQREAINRFTTAEIKIGMTNNNSIGNDMDIDGVIGKLTDKLYGAMSAAAEGEHS